MFIYSRENGRICHNDSVASKRRVSAFGSPACLDTATKIALVHLASGLALDVSMHWSFPRIGHVILGTPDRCDRRKGTKVHAQFW